MLLDLLYEALYVPPGQPPLPRSALAQPEIARYATGFGSREGDVGFIAEDGAQCLGAAWARLPEGDDRGFGYVADDVPELTIAVHAGFRGRGIGTGLMASLIGSAPRLSLSVDRRNPAVSLYRRFGFLPVAQLGDAVTMLRRPGASG